MAEEAAVIAMPNDEGGVDLIFIAPQSDPCWYCHGAPGDDLVFSWEFDTFVHLTCIRARVAEDPSDDEAAIFAREFERELRDAPGERVS